MCLVFNKVAVGNVNLEDKIAEPVRALIEYYGGEVKSDLEECTHMLAVKYDNEAMKIDETQVGSEKTNEENGDTKVMKKPRIIVTPDWIVDCVKENRLLEEVAYHPKYLKNDPKNSELITQMERKEKEEKVS